MAYTSHGHHIPGSDDDGPAPTTRARCGSPGLCSQCSRESNIWQQENTPEIIADPPAETFIEKAERIVFDYVKSRLEKTDIHVTFARDEVYIVWFSKTLQNWKGLLSTTLPDGMYYEVTYNGDKDETYLDAYKKFDNVKIVG